MAETAVTTSSVSSTDAPVAHLGPSVEGPAKDFGPLPGDPSKLDAFEFLAPDDPRRMMADRQLRPFGVFDVDVLAAFDAVARDRFVAPDFSTVAYADTPMPCASGRRQLLAPLILGRMLQEALPLASDRALDVAGGSGYSACVLGRVVKTVTALEGEGVDVSASLGGNVTRVTGPVADGWEKTAPYDLILVNGVIETEPTKLLTQLAEGGRLIALERQGAAVQAVRYDRVGSGFNRRLAFNASGPVIAEFKAAPSFKF
jgi:protein-L-isoaspartate(D-aspartate) O-methyltransferase